MRGDDPHGDDVLVEMLRKVSGYPGMSLRLYAVAGSLSGPHWQGSITWDGAEGQIAESGFKIACRSDPIAAMADCVRQALTYPVPPPRSAAKAAPPPADDDDDDILGGPAPAADDEDILG